jgi:hypothetical protein
LKKKTGISLNGKKSKEDQPEAEIKATLALTAEEIKERKQLRVRRMKRFLKQMTKSDVRENYITTVDRHVEKLLENVKAKEIKQAGKRGFGSSGASSGQGSRHKSQQQQVNESKDKIDISTSDSILTHVSNPRMLLNPSTFSSLPLYYQYKLTKALPTCDQSLTEQGWIKPSSSALSNEFFTKAVSEWMESLKEGKLTQEVINKKKQDMERERSRLDPWKVKHFEPIWGKNNSCHSESVSEFDRIPRTIIPDLTPRISLDRKPRPLSRKLESSKRIRLSKEKVTETMTPTEKISVSGAHDLISMKQISTSQQECSTTRSITSMTTASGNSVKISLVSPETASSSLLFSALCSVSSERVKTDLESGTVQDNNCLTDSSSPDKMGKRNGKSSRRSPRAPSTTSKQRISGPLNKNVEGVDEHRSLLICQNAIAKSANNKLFVVTDHGKIQTVEDEESQDEQKPPNESVECNDALSILSHAALLPRDVEIIPVCSSTSSSTAAVCLTKDQERKQQQHPVLSRNEDRPLSGITVQTLINGFIHEQLVNNNSGETSKSSNNNMTHSYDPNQNILANILTQNRGTFRNRTSNTESSSVSSLPYKLPNGLTITPYQDSSRNQVPVIIRSEASTHEATASVISTSSLHRSKQVISPSKTGHYDNSGDSDISSGGTDEVLTRLPPHITIIPLGSSMAEQQDIPINMTQHVIYQTSGETSPSFNQTRSPSQLTPDEGVGDETPEGLMMLQENGYHGNEEEIEDERSRHECNLKALVPCSGCGAFCHSACITIDPRNGNLCPNCLMRMNYSGTLMSSSVSNPQGIVYHQHHVSM